MVEQCCPLLKRVIENGNITTYEWRTGKPPLSIASHSLPSSTKQQPIGGQVDTEVADGVDWADIDFGDEEDVAGDGGDIDFGEVCPHIHAVLELHDSDMEKVFFYHTICITAFPWVTSIKVCMAS